MDKEIKSDYRVFPYEEDRKNDEEEDRGDRYEFDEPSWIGFY
jgi:hypothetical protein